MVGRGVIAGIDVVVATAGLIVFLYFSTRAGTELRIRGDLRTRRPRVRLVFGGR